MLPINMIQVVLLVFHRFVTIHGYPSKFVSDNGSQIVAGAKEMSEIMKNWEWQRLNNFGVSYGTKFVI